MEQTVTILCDDMELARGSQVAADDTVIISITWPSKGGVPVHTRLDLCEVNVKQFMADMSPWLEAGHVHVPPAPAPAAAEPPAAGKAIPVKGTPDYYKGLRAYLDARNIKWQFPSGVAYSKEDRNKYDEYLAALSRGQEPEV
jgi:hypothetical protein